MICNQLTFYMHGTCVHKFFSKKEIINNSITSIYNMDPLHMQWDWPPGYSPSKLHFLPDNIS